MASEKAIQYYRRWYRQLLRLYPRPYYERFGQEMEQTFGDLCREHAQTDRILFGSVFWMCVDTSVAIIKENFYYMAYTTSIIRVGLVTLGLLLLPVFGNLYIEGWNWSVGDFIFAFVLIFSAGLAFELVRTGSRPWLYKAAVGMALVGSFLLIWINAAVGLIGDDNPANILYLGVVAIGLCGAFVVRLKPGGMARTLLVMAFVQMVIPVWAFIFWPSNFAPGVPGVFALNAFFALLFTGSGLLFRRASVAGAIGRRVP